MNGFFTKLGERLRGEGARGTATTAILIAAVIAVNVIVYALTVAFGWYFYTAETADFSISGATDALFEEAIGEGKQVKITFCMPEEDVEKHDTGSYVLQTARQFAERYPTFVSLDFVNIITRRNAAGERVDIDRYKEDADGHHYAIFRTSVIFECGETFRVLTDATSGAGYVDFYTLDANNLATSYNGEEVMAAMVAWVLQPTHKSAYFTIYHGETVDVAFTNLLASAGFYVGTVDLRSQDVPDDAGLLLISNPVKDFEKAAEGSGLKTEIEHLAHYIEGGGNVYVALDPYAPKLPILENFLAGYGIAVSETLPETGKAVRHIVKDPTNAITTDGFTLVADYASGESAGNIAGRATQYGGRVIIKDAAALVLSDGAEAVLLSSAGSTTEASGVTADRGGSYPIAAIAETGDAHIFVVSSVYLTAADALVTGGYANKDFLFSVFEECFGASRLPYGCRARVFETGTLENLTMGTAKTVTAILLAIPAAIAVVGGVLLVRRKNR